MKTTNQLIEEGLSQAKTLGINFDYDDGTSAEWLRLYSERLVESARTVERKYITQQLNLNIPVMTAKKPVAYNEGVASGWYASKAFLQSLPSLADKSKQRLQVVKVRNGLWELRWENGDVSQHSTEKAARLASLRFS